MHTVHKHLIIEVFLHLGDIDYSSVGQLLKLGIVDVGAVHCRYLVLLIMAWREHERVVGSSRRVLYITWHTLIGVYHCMNLDAAFLLSRFGMTSHSLENGIGEQCHGRRIDDAQPFYPFFRTVTPAVR